MNQEFKYLSNYLKDNNISYAQAGKKCGRTATAVRSWVYGAGINDNRVKKRICTIMEVEIKDVEEEVAKYNVLIQKQSMHLPSYTITECCEQIDSMFTRMLYFDDNRHVPVNTQEFIKKMAKNFCNNLKEIQALDLK